VPQSASLIALTRPGWSCPGVAVRASFDVAITQPFQSLHWTPAFKHLQEQKCPSSKIRASHMMISIDMAG
jgi:hypothetical protein